MYLRPIILHIRHVSLKMRMWETCTEHVGPILGNCTEPVRTTHPEKKLQVYNALYMNQYLKLGLNVSITLSDYLEYEMCTNKAYNSFYGPFILFTFVLYGAKFRSIYRSFWNILRSIKSHCTEHSHFAGTLSP